MVDIVGMFVCIALLLWMAHKTAVAVFWLMVPYLFWTGYALALNATIYYRNVV